MNDSQNFAVAMLVAALAGIGAYIIIGVVCRFLARICQ